MVRYQNKGGGSGVYAYEICADRIHVQFSGNSKVYTYSDSGKAGRRHVDNMKALALNGQGLNAYINQYTKYLYDQC